jgi:glycine oxidase
MLDDREPGMGATHASAGMLAPHLEAPREGPLLELTVRGLQRFDDFIVRLVDDSGMPVEYRRSGSLSVAMGTQEASRLDAIAEALVRRGVAAEALDGVTVHREHASLSRDVVGGLFIAPHGYVSAAALTDASVTAAKRFGARVERAGRVHRVRKDGAGVRAETVRGTFTAAHMVLAAGSWSGAIDVEGAARLPVHPVRGQLVHLRCDTPALRHVTWSDRCYLVPWDDGSVLVGATVEHVGFAEQATVEGVSGLLDAARSVVPGLEAAVFVAARAGLRPQSADGLPIIGSSVALPHVTYATGHFRNGVLLAPLTAQLVADAIVDGRVDPLLASTRPARFGVV